MPDLDDRFFNGSGDIPPDITGRLVTPSFGDNDSRILTQLGWEGQAIGYIGLVITPDGDSIDRGQFCVKGKLSEDAVTFQAAKLWAGVAKDVIVSIEPIEGQIFKFLGGTMFSDYLPQEALKVSYHKGDQRIRNGEESRHNIGDVCFRLFCHLDKTSNIRSGQGPQWKLTTLAFPHTVEELEEESQLAQHPSWPGIKILEGKADLFPAADLVPWGCPILPLLSTEARSGSIGTIPKGAVLRAAVAALCRTAALPTACASRAAAAKKCQEMNSNPPPQHGREPTVKWPKSAMPPADGGRTNIY
jgi:hypothetical protein